MDQLTYHLRSMVCRYGRHGGPPQPHYVHIWTERMRKVGSFCINRQEVQEEWRPDGILLLLGRPLSTLPCRVLASPDPYSRALLGCVESACGGGGCGGNTPVYTRLYPVFVWWNFRVRTAGVRFRNHGFFQSVRDMCSLFRWWKVRSLFWTGRRNHRAGWYLLMR